MIFWKLIGGSHHGRWDWCFALRSRTAVCLHPLYLLAEWYLAVAGAVLVHQITGNGRKSLLTYSVLLILPTVIADGAILRNNACVGALLIVSALLFLENGCGWLFSVVLSAALLLHVRYVGLLAVCMLLWQMRKLNNLQLVLPVNGGCSAVLSIVTGHGWELDIR